MGQRGWRDKLPPNQDVVTSRFGHMWPLYIQLNNIPCSSLPLYNFLYLFLSFSLKINFLYFETYICSFLCFLNRLVFFASLTFQVQTGCCLLTLPGCQPPKHMVMPRMSGSLERLDNCAVSINFLAAEAQKQHQQKDLFKYCCKKNLQSS